ncbi:aminotransferase class III-fold pyridoxal phosphate-dependent enzyme [Botrimarina hoheduenensis]|uniref:Succinylornithine transaminase n=1 Tax=Botrimarina hoheduenensis TaxID=2528000 RepID=A0A5C5WAX7_9BACT|nr:aminotransferase class III-fold pyridoxal phosphate-dependent enzyme [Botrimarina hoheduenensis]TWT47830.1 Succinylornithine transaminase [Botrimarina hoheduenensis]
MSTLLNQTTSHAPSAERLNAIYAKRLIPAEKKPFLIDLEASSGPYMAVRGGGLICDGASQIASIGLGFNPGAQFGAGQHLESWTNQTNTPHYAAVRAAYEALLQRKLGSDRFAACFCASGAEANETVLGHLFEHRRHPSARRVLAFEGSFHGRMFVSLASTWNPAKREPFTLPGHESIFVPYPVMEGDDVHAPAEPDGWQAVWTETDDTRHQTLLSKLPTAADAGLAAEAASLSAVRSAILAGEVLAILIEPMQCEGGDRYSSRRFHQGLALLSHTHNTPLVYDEIQTGFGLGAEFFWHRKFCLQTPAGDEFFPAGVVCAKKAQAGVALVYQPQGPIQAGAATAIEQTSAASVVRGYIQASVIDQFHDELLAMESENRQRLTDLVERQGDRVRAPRVQGMSFAFDLDSADEVGRFVAQRFQHGLLYYPAGAKTARFRMNLGFAAADRDLFWSQLEEALDSTFAEASDAAIGAPADTRTRGAASYYQVHSELIEAKLDLLHEGKRPAVHDALALVERHVATAYPAETLTVVRLEAAKYPAHRDRIVAMQEAVYEPTRRSSAEEFDALFAGENPLALAVLKGDRIVAMAFAGPLARFDYMRGVKDDPSHDDPTVHYAMDLTIDEQFRGGLGRAMKQAMTLLALATGVSALHGRNRDRMAAGMWSINLSLGAYVSQYLPRDYPDQERYRDCLYYRAETAWSAPIDLASGIEAPLGPAHLDAAFVRRNLPVLVNKLTLSNFVTDDFLTDLETVSHAFPAPLRRLYTASGLSEAVDKIVKVLWTHRKPRTGLLTIAGSDFGSGSFMSRSLSGAGEAYFATDSLPLPRDAADEPFFRELESRVASDTLMGVFVEPLMRRTLQRVSQDALTRLVTTCRDHGVPVVYNDTAGMFYRYSSEAFGPSAVEGMQPDATIAYLGGQTALVAASDALFLEEPLLLISTWDGDALSLAQFARAMTLVQDDQAAYHQTVAAYQQKIDTLLAGQPGVTSTLARGVGLIQGPLSEPLMRHLAQQESNLWRSCPAYSEMLRFNAANLGS